MTRLLVVLVILLGLCSSAWAISSDTYKLGPEDAITVSVLRHPELSGDFLIPADGVIILPGAGKVEASGKTLSELTQAITKFLSDRLNNPEVSIALKTQREQRVYILGTVKLPGVYDYKPGWRITEALAAAGGILGDLEDCEASVLKASTGKQQNVKIVDVLDSTTSSNLALEPGDVVSINTVRLLPIYVVGQVKNPGMYPMREGGGVLEALALADGTLDNASLSNITITHISGESETVDLVPAIIHGKKEGNRKLQPGDLVVVPESGNRIAVLGYVNKPGYFTFKDGQPIKLSDAIGLAGGNIIKKSALDSILILRTKDDKQEKLVYNLSSFLREGDLKANPEILAGDVIYVPRNSSPDWESIIRALASVSVLYNAIY